MIQKTEWSIDLVFEEVYFEQNLAFTPYLVHYLFIFPII